jgi:uncharacterized protein
MSPSSSTVHGPNRRVSPARVSAFEASHDDDGLVGQRALRRYLTVVLGLGIPLLALPVVTDLPDGVAILVSTYVLLLGGAILTATRPGYGGVRQLFAGALRWRIGLSSWAFVTLALPGAAIAIAWLTGTLVAPPDGWAQTVIDYLIFTFLIGTLALNLWEETAWQGLVQRRLTRRHGLRKGAVLTAIPFAMLHVPLSFIGDVALPEALLSTAVLFVAAPFLRYLFGRTDQTTGGSLLAVGVLHASFNATGAMEVLDGGWQHFAAVVVIASLVLLVHSRHDATTAT